MSYFTDLYLERMMNKKREKREFVVDSGCPGLFAVFHPSGKAAFTFIKRLNGKQEKQFLGYYSKTLFPIPKAREMVKEFSEAMESEIPKTPKQLREEKLKTRKATQEAEEKNKKILEAETVALVGQKWLDLDQRDKRTFDETESFFNKRLKTAWGDRPISSITKKDALAFVDDYATKTSSVRARRAFAWVHRFFAWCVERDILQFNPMTGAKKPGVENDRDRVLTDKELVEVWRASDFLDIDPQASIRKNKNQFYTTQPLFGSIVKLLILTGARRQEICGLKWSELDLENGIAILPGERTKRDPKHKDVSRMIYLSQKAVDILSKIKPLTGCPFVFSTTGKTAVEGGINKVKERLIRLIQKARLENGIKDEIPPFWLHDLRRTAATNFQKLGVPLPVTETVLGHLSGSRSGIVKVYQRYGYEAEARQAVDAWASTVDDFLAGRFKKKVVALLRAQAS